MSKKIITSVLMILAFHQVLNGQQTGIDISNSLEITVNEKFVIGAPSSSTLSGSLGDPENIFTDSKGKIYIADQGTMSIKLFDEKGSYIQEIGRRGRGPGEFLSIEYMFINDRDEFYVLDPNQFRVTKFNQSGEYLSTFNTSKKSQDINFFRQVIPLENGQFLALYKQWGAGRYAKYESDHLFHIWDSTFQDKISASGSFNELGYKDEYGRRFLRSRVGKIIRIEKKEIILAPFLYKGTLFRYKKDGNRWQLQNRIKGYQSNQPASLTLNKNDPRAGSSHSYGEKTLYGTVNILSSGIFKFNEKYIVHFSIRKSKENEEEWIFGVEVIDENFQFKGFYPIAVKNGIYTIYDTLVQWKDNRGQFYMLDEEQGVPVVRVFSLDIREK